MFVENCKQYAIFNVLQQRDDASLKTNTNLKRIVLMILKLFELEREGMDYFFFFKIVNVPLLLFSNSSTDINNTNMHLFIYVYISCMYFILFSTIFYHIMNMKPKLENEYTFLNNHRIR